MQTKTKKLIKVAENLSKKYAGYQEDSIKKTLTNAALQGHFPMIGGKPFTKVLEEHDIAATLPIKISGRLISLGKDSEVGSFVFDQNTTSNEYKFNLANYINKVIPKSISEYLNNFHELLNNTPPGVYNITF